MYMCIYSHCMCVTYRLSHIAPYLTVMTYFVCDTILLCVVLFQQSFAAVFPRHT